MAIRPPGPYSVQYPLIFNELSHIVEVNCDTVGTPSTGDDPTTVYLRTKDGVGATLEDSANALWDLLRPFFQGLTLCSTYTLWKHNPLNNDKLFISGGTLVHANGSNPGANTPAGQAIYTWRSGGGNTMKIALLEGVFTSNSSIPLASDTLAQVIALNAFILSGADFVMARDRSFPVAAMKSSYGQNEKIFNRRFRA